MIAEIVTGAVTALAGMFFIGLPIFGWEEVETFLTPTELPSMRAMLVIVFIMGAGFFVSGTITLFNFIG